jgi:hypothetical protein
VKIAEGNIGNEKIDPSLNIGKQYLFLSLIKHFSEVD